MALSEKLDKLKARIKAAEQAKRDHKANWLMNIMFYKGEQWVKFDRPSGRFLPIREPLKHEWRSMRTDNYFQPIAQVMSAKLTQNRPTMYLDPANSDYKAKAKARVGRKILEFTWDSLDLQRKVAEAVLWGVVTGCGWWAIYYDDNAGDLVVDPATGQKVRSGSPRVDVVKPTDIGLDPMAENLNAVEFAYRVRYVSTDWIKAFLNKKATPDQPGSDDFYLDPDLRQAPAVQNAEISAGLDKEYVTLWEYYDLVKKKLHWLTKEEILYTQDWDLGLPFVPFVMTGNLGDFYNGRLTSGQVWGDTIMNQLRELQVELNKAESQIVDCINLTAMPRLLASKQANIQGNTYTTNPGGVVQWSGLGQPPKQLEIGILPAYVVNRPRELIARMFDISGIHEISQGTNPGSIQSARGLMFLAEMDATKFGPMARNITASLQVAMIRILEMWHAFGKYDILQQIVGPNEGLDYEIWRMDDLTSFSVRVVEGSTLATSKALRRQDLMQAWNMGVIKDDREMRKLLEFDTTDKLEGDWDDDRYQQKRENYQIMQGRPVQVHPWDNDFAHMDEIEKILKSPDYESFPPEIQQAYAQHWSAHQQKIVQAQQAQQMAAMQRGTAFAGAPQSESVSVQQSGSSEPVSLHLGVTPQQDAAAGITPNTMNQ